MFKKDSERIRQINKELIIRGMTFKEIDEFWQDCIKIAKKKKVKNRYEKRI